MSFTGMRDEADLEEGYRQSRLRDHVEGISNSENTDDEYGMFGCCATCAIHSFPGDKSLRRDTREDKAELDKIKKAIVKRILEHCNSIVKMNKSIATATVNTNQTIAAECLEEAGFVSPTDWCHRSGRGSTQVKVYIRAVYKETKHPTK